MGSRMLLEKAVQLKEIADSLISYAKYLEEKEDEEKELPSKDEDYPAKKKMIVAILKNKLHK